MAVTINVDSFSPENLRESTTLSQAHTAGAVVLNVTSSADYAVGDIIYVGTLGAEGCEKASVASVASQTTINLSEALKLDHAAYEDVTSVLGDKVHIYRAVNVTDQVPDADAFSVLATREIDADNTSTYYQDSAGSSAYWYCFTYFNETTQEETARSTPFRGEDYAHYVSLRDIRQEAGLEKAYRLKDSLIALKRREAEAEVNGALANIYTVPFDPVPEAVRTLTLQLAGALLLDHQFGGYSAKLKEIRANLKAYANRDATITDADGNATSPDSISFYPDESAPRFFRMEDVF